SPDDDAKKEEVHLFKDLLSAELIDVLDAAQGCLELNLEPGLLAHLARRRLIEGLALVHVSLGQRPNHPAARADHRERRRAVALGYNHSTGRSLARHVATMSNSGGVRRMAWLRIRPEPKGVAKVRNHPFQ